VSVWGIARRHLALLLVGIGLGVLGAAAALVQPLVMREMIQAVAEHRALSGPILLAVAMFAAEAALTAARAYAIGRAGENVVFDIRQTLTLRLLRSRLPAYERWDQGDVFTRLVTDTSLARVSLTQALSQIVTSGFMVVGGIVMMAWLDPLMLAATLGCLGTAAAISLFLGRRLRAASLVNRRDSSVLGSAIIRVLGALPTVKASRAERRESGRVDDLAHRARRSGIRASALSALLTPAMNTGSQVAMTVATVWGMSRVATGAMSPADMTSFMMYLFYLVAPLVQLFMAIAQFQQGRASIDRVAELGTIEQEDPTRGVIAAFRGHHLAFDRVTFAYPRGEAPALNEVSFTVPERGLTAIIGPSGAGKSTICQLVERLHDPDSGAVRIGGVDIRWLRLEQLRSLVGYVDQDHTLLRGTIRENLTFASPQASERDIADALRLAHLTDVVDALPEGLDTELGERGAGLSGGQRQRLAIARALLQRPRILLLDEATANLDGESEAALRATLAAVSRRCAVVAITHRLATIEQARKIIVLDRGTVATTGVHADLVKINRLYNRLADHREAA
jgi:ABC-type multidrug transport system fused ATPase/permease subunit